MSISIAQLIDEDHESRAESPRPHMGASMLGHPCDRWIWLSFRFAVIEKFPGRILRLFRRGHNEEKTIISDLRSIGMDVRSSQSRVDFGNHVSGSMDGIIMRGVPDAPGRPHVAEFKTHSKKSFDELEKVGVAKSKPVHYTQMQVYMLGSDIDRALYVAVCKDDDRIYSECVEYDKEHAERAIERGHRIVSSDRMPEPISSDPSWYQCKFCAAYEFCHKTHLTKEVNCRTCANSTAMKDSTWHCARWEDSIPFTHQLEACDSHVLHPDLVPWQRKDSHNEWEAVYEIDGEDVRNGDHDAFVFSSIELISNPEMCVSLLRDDNKFVDDLRTKFGARITG